MFEAPIVLAPYDPSWPYQFHQERRELEHVLENWLVGPIEHVGSTAVPGLAAKLVVDIMAGVENLETSQPAIALLSAAGYCYAPYRPDVDNPFFSLSGDWIAYFDNNRGLKKIRLGGGAGVPVPLTNAPAGVFRGGSWSSEGTIVFSSSASLGLMRLSESGGTAEALTKPSGEVHARPYFLPDGRALVHTIQRPRAFRALITPSPRAFHLMEKGCCLGKWHHGHPSAPDRLGTQHRANPRNDFQ